MPLVKINEWWFVNTDHIASLEIKLTSTLKYVVHIHLKNEIMPSRIHSDTFDTMEEAQAYMQDIADTHSCKEHDFT